MTYRAQISVDHVVVAVGSEANTDLAESSGLEVHSELGGFLVNSELAARTDLYAVSNLIFPEFKAWKQGNVGKNRSSLFPISLRQNF